MCSFLHPPKESNCITIGNPSKCFTYHNMQSAFGTVAAGLGSIFPSNRLWSGAGPALGVYWLGPARHIGSLAKLCKRGKAFHNLGMVLSAPSSNHRHRRGLPHYMIGPMLARKCVPNVRNLTHRVVLKCLNGLDKIYPGTMLTVPIQSALSRKSS
jgi:hypothetical protein